MFDSVRARMTLWYTGVLTLVLVTFAVITYVFLVRAMNQQTDAGLAEMAHSFVASLEAEQADESEIHTSDKIIIEVANDFRFRDYQLLIYDASGSLIAASNSSLDLSTKAASRTRSIVSDIELTKLINSSNMEPTYTTLNSTNEETRAYFTLLEIDKRKYGLVVLHPLRDEALLRQRIKEVFLLGIPLALLFATLGGYLLACKSLAPVVDMGRQAAGISAKNLHERLPVKNERDELGELARVFNELLERLDASFEQQRRFMADASHELRTPVAIMRGEAEVALSKNERTLEDYRESLFIVHDESKRLTRIVEDLFTLARADAGQLKLTLTKFYLDEVASDCVRSVRSLSAHRGLALNFTATEEMPMRGDEQLLRRLVLNLLDNAIKYTPRGGNITVTCESKDDFYHVTVTDTGIGIAPEEQQRIFKRFYRIDKARSRSPFDFESTLTGGAGLGLSIARWIAEVHNGRLELERSDNTGSSFVLTLPRNSRY